MNSSKSKSKEVKKAGIFTRNAIETFENNIVNQTNYLEKVKEDEVKDKELKS